MINEILAKLPANLRLELDSKAAFGDYPMIYRMGYMDGFFVVLRSLDLITFDEYMILYRHYIYGGDAR